MGGASAPFFMAKKNWRDDGGLISTIRYKKSFAFMPVDLDGDKVWLKVYYKKYQNWKAPYGGGNGHTDFIENITEAEYIIRKLTEKF
jgi:hypothetical protein